MMTDFGPLKSAKGLMTDFGPLKSVGDLMTDFLTLTISLNEIKTDV